MRQLEEVNRLEGQFTLHNLGATSGLKTLAGRRQFPYGNSQSRKHPVTGHLHPN